MSRILDSMKTRIDKIDAKIKPLIEEKENLMQAISILEKQQEVTPETPVVVKEPSPHFLKKSHDQKPA